LHRDLKLANVFVGK